MEEYVYKDMYGRDIYVNDTVLIALKTGNIVEARVVGRDNAYFHDIKLVTLHSKRALIRCSDGCYLKEEGYNRFRLGE